jgi:tRNA 5-methylaminomethyl-2-thiouridine biosynthesis bifunctional protein
MPRYFPIQPAELDWQDNVPFSRRHQDIYFSREGGLEETRHVFLQGNQLPQRWQNATHFTIAETGFGTGLNFLCTLQEWRKSAATDASLHFISVEKYPLSKTDLQQALSSWPELDSLSAELLHNYPPLVHGLHRREFLDGRVTLTLLFGDAAAMFSDISAEVDAWYLDGFAPGQNADMWSDDLFHQIARLTKLHGTFATFTAAGAVKRGLKKAGFELATRPGFGRKRDMLSGTLKTDIPKKSSQPWFEYPKCSVTEKRAVVIGAGLAGCTVSRALAQRGWQVSLIERHDNIAQEASGNLAGVVMPRLTADMSVDGRFYLSAFLHAIHWLNALKQRDPELPWFQSGVMQLCDTQQQLRMEKLGLPPEVLEICDRNRASERCGTTVRRGGLFYPGGGWLDPPALCRWLLGDQWDRIELIPHHTALSLDRHDDRWQIMGKSGVIASAETVIITNGHDAQRLLGTDILALQKVRGQLAYLRADTNSQALKTPVCHDGYIIPVYQGMHCVGASYDIGDDSKEISAKSETEILDKLKNELPEMTELEIAAGRVAFRTSTQDHLPHIGPVPDIDFYKEHYSDLHHGKPAGRYPAALYLPNLFISTGHGSRGLISCTMAADFITTKLIKNSPPTKELMSAVHSARFLVRKLKQPT